MPSEMQNGTTPSPTIFARLGSKWLLFIS